ncbi:hypothetical protein A4X13_0g1826 [Tilletia indica]|uniref:Uncharacterized protein n=1 Tax=Tilletia indica TaxID=43049 RepID=A0A8T8TAA2_9BASI|nr:hypothetical protein A4X13_0g1826 [Tilletia indica]
MPVILADDGDHVNIMTLAEGLLPHLLPIRALDFRRLVRLLSSSKYLPGSLHVRNRLLHPFLVGEDAHGPLPAGKLDISTAWDRVFKGEDPVAGWAIGSVPTDLLAVSSEEASKPEARRTQGPWGVFLLSPGLLYKQEGIKSDGRSPPRTPRLDLWLSKPSTQDESSSGLLRAIIERVVPHLLLRSRREREAEGDEVQQAGTQGSKIKWMCCGFDESEAEGVRRLAQVAQSDDDNPARGLAITFDNPCLRFIGSSEVLSGAPAIHHEKDGDEEEWRLDQIREEDIRDVISTNKIPYPPFYVRDHAHISSLVRRRRPSSGGEKVHDEAAGWTYFHSNLSVASLYVRPDYRSSKITVKQSNLPPQDGQDEPVSGDGSAIPQKMGIGTLVSLDLAQKLVQAQRKLLAALNLDDLLLPPTGQEGSSDDMQRFGFRIGPCDVLAESELGNVGAHAFMVKGPKFRQAGLNSWMLVELRGSLPSEEDLDIPQSS